MDVVDFILNLAGLLLWMSWRSEHLDTAYRAPVISLAHAVRKAASSPLEKWKPLAILTGLLLVRGLIYRQVSGSFPHSFKLHLIPLTLVFPNNHRGLMLFYSMLSFLFALAYFHLALLLFSLVNRRGGERDGVHKFVCVHLGWLERLPVALKWLLPFCGGMLLWMVSAHALARLQVASAPASFAELWQKAAVVGAGVYLQWQWITVAVLLLYLINCYVYLGRFPLWEYIQSTGHNLLAPLQVLPLRSGKADFTPILGIAIVTASAVLLESGWKFSAPWIPAFITRGVLPWLYQNAPF